MKKSDLKHGMVVEYRNGNKRVLIKGAEDLLVGEDGYSRLDNYDSDLLMIAFKGLSIDLSDLDIMKVYEGSSELSYWGEGLKSVFKYKGQMLWERKGVVEMSLEEVEKKLGLKPGQLRIKSDQAN